ncbi:hypothetical protein K3L59_004415 [Salmonella enterica]|nr:hypothetical protein [Salmonella enterica]
MPPSGRAVKGRAPAALKGAALRAASLHPRLLIVSITGLPVGNILSLSFCMALFSVPVCPVAVPCLFWLAWDNGPLRLLTSWRCPVVEPHSARAAAAHLPVSAEPLRGSCHTARV